MSVTWGDPIVRHGGRRPARQTVETGRLVPIGDGHRDWTVILTDDTGRVRRRSYGVTERGGLRIMAAWSKSGLWRTDDTA